MPEHIQIGQVATEIEYGERHQQIRKSGFPSKLQRFGLLITDSSVDWIIKDYIFLSFDGGAYSHCYLKKLSRKIIINIEITLECAPSQKQYPPLYFVTERYSPSWTDSHV